MNAKENIFGKTLQELKDIAVKLELPGYAAKQLSHWLYGNKVTSFAGMTNLSLQSRDKLSDHFILELTPPVHVSQSEDGTKKYLFRVQEDRYIEAVYIPDGERKTLCVSTQVGCKMGCVFCMTGKQGFHGDLGPADILNQVTSVPEAGALTNLVFMGMGEPMDNVENLLKTLEILTSSYGYAMSPSRITVSTIGVLPGMKAFLENSRCHLAVSLNSPFGEERQELMPVEKKYPVSSVVEFLKSQPADRQRRISFEYIMFRGINDTARHINGLTRLLNGLKCRINLIRYHELPDVHLKTSDEETILWFKNKLNEKGILTTVRASRGQDIMAACGLLSTLARMQE